MQAFETETLNISDKFSFDMPDITNENQWNSLVAQLLFNAEKFAQRVSQMQEAEFDLPFIDPKYVQF